MYKEDEFDLMIRESLREEAACISASDHCKEMIDAQIAGYTAARSRSETEVTMKKRTLKRMAAAAAVCCLLLGTAVYAAGKITSIYSHGSSEMTVKEFDDIGTLETEAGFDILSQEAFSNGYTFVGGQIVNSEGRSEDGNTISSWKNINLEYRDEDGRRMFIDMAPADAEQPHLSADAEPSHLSADALSSVAMYGTEVYYNRIEYYSVPADYRPTPEEEARSESDPHYTIAYGADEPSTTFISEAAFAHDGVIYMIMSFDDAGEDVLYSMAEQLLAGDR